MTGLQRSGLRPLAGVFIADVGRCPSPAFSKLTELAEDKQCFLKHVKQFCTRVSNDWYRVYLVRKLSSQRGMEFVQSFSRQGHPCQWVFPRNVIAQQVRNRVSGSKGMLLQSCLQHPVARLGAESQCAAHLCLPQCIWEMGLCICFSMPLTITHITPMDISVCVCTCVCVL